MKSTPISNTIWQLGVLTLLALSMPASAQDDWKSWSLGKQWQISAALFTPSLDTKLIVTDSDNNIGTGISFEDNLGLDDSKSTVLVGVDWRFFKRHRISYNYFDLARDASAESSVAIAIGDEVFDVTLPIQSFFDITANELAYSYSLLFDEKKDLSIGLGLSVQDLALGIRGTASSPNPGEVINSRLSSTAPLPTLNLGFNYAFTEQWLFVSKLGWLAVEADLGADEKLEGQIINANLGVEWRAFNNAGFFLKYQIVDVDVDVTEENELFALDYDYSGPLLGVNVTF